MIKTKHTHAMLFFIEMHINTKKKLKEIYKERGRVKIKEKRTKDYIQIFIQTIQPFHS